MSIHEQTLQNARDLFLRLHQDNCADVNQAQGAVGIEMNSIAFLEALLENAKQETQASREVKLLLVNHVAAIASTDTQGLFGEDTLAVRIQQTNPDEFYISLGGRFSMPDYFTRDEQFNLSAFASAGVEITVISGDFIDIRLGNTSRLFSSSRVVQEALDELNDDERATLAREFLTLMITQLQEDAFPLSTSDVQSLDF